MNFHPKSEQELEEERRQRLSLLVPGECDFEVRTAEDTRSESGNDMIKLTLDVWDSAGTQAVVFDYLLDAMAYKMRHFCYSCGMGHIYEQGTLDGDSCIGKSGRVVIRTEQDRMKKYPAKNAVQDYVVAERTKETQGYRTAKQEHSQGGNGATTLDAAGAVQAARKRAWDAHTAKNQGIGTEALTDRWRKVMHEVISDKKSTEFTAAEWVKVQKRVEAPTSPISEEPVFADDSIPF